MKNILAHFAVAILLVVSGSGCTPIKYGSVQEAYDAKILTTSDLVYLRDKEWPPLKDDVVDGWTRETVVQRPPDNIDPVQEVFAYSSKSGSPNVCMSFSGGGIRSGSFSIGVMAGLHEAGKLDAIDIMSSVSGGGYALSWFYMQHYNYGNGKSLNRDQLQIVRDLMFKAPSTKSGELEIDESSYQGYLLAHSRLMTEADYMAMIVPHMIFAVPAHIVANGLLSLRTRIGLPYEIYKERLAKTFHRGPKSTAINIPTIFELGEFSKNSGLPFFLFNTTAWPGDKAPNELELTDSVFSFSPIRYGSAAYGLYRYDGDKKAPKQFGTTRDLQINEVVALSGGAADSNHVLRSRIGQTLASAFAFDLGAYIPNPAISSDQRNAHMVRPFPFYLWNRHKNDLRGVGIYLSDGGHSENLGAYPLIARNCKTIVIVDGEHDPYYRFDSYFRLKARLEREHIEMNVPDIDDKEKVNFKRLKEMFAESPRKSVDDAPEAYMDEIKLNSLKNEKNNEWWIRSLKSDPSVGDRWGRYAENPVMKGTIKRPGGIGSINVEYVKLAYRPDKSSTSKATKQDFSITNNPSDLESWLRSDRSAYYNTGIGPECTTKEMHDPILDYYYCIKQKRMIGFYPLGVSEPFPQQPTKDQNFSPKQFHAYVELGRYIGKLLANAIPSPSLVTK